MANYTITDYNNLVQSIIQGTKEVRYSDKTVVYRTLEEMAEIKRMMEAALKLDQNGNPLVSSEEGQTYRKGRRIADFHDTNK